MLNWNSQRGTNNSSLQPESYVPLTFKNKQNLLIERAEYTQKNLLLQASCNFHHCSQLYRSLIDGETKQEELNLCARFSETTSSTAAMGQLLAGQHVARASLRVLPNPGIHQTAEERTQLHRREKSGKKNQHKKHTTQQPSTNRDSSTVEPHSAVTSFSSITLTRLFFSLTYLLSQSRSPFFSPLSMLVPSSANLNKKHTCWKWLKGNMCRVSLLLLPTLQLLMNFQTQKDISTGNPQRGLIALLGD